MPFAQRGASAAEIQILDRLLRDSASAVFEFLQFQVGIHGLLEGQQVEAVMLIKARVFTGDNGAAQFTWHLIPRNRCPLQGRQRVIQFALALIMKDELRFY